MTTEEEVTTCEQLSGGSETGSPEREHFDVSY